MCKELMYEQQLFVYSQYERKELHKLQSNVYVQHHLCNQLLTCIFEDKHILKRYTLVSTKDFIAIICVLECRKEFIWLYVR